MKKAIVLILIFLVLEGALASCERFVPAGEGGRPSLPPIGEETQATEGTAPTDATGPAEEKDPTVDEYGFKLFPEGNYLADPMFDTEEYLPDYDADPSNLQCFSTWTVALCSTEDSIYSSLHVLGRNTQLIVYTDKATGISLPLCGKPECLHNDVTCNASAGPLGIAGLAVYDGKLYWGLCGNSVIQRMNLDGTGRETVCATSLNFRENMNANPMVMFHRGYYYMAGTKHQLIINGKAASLVTVRAQPLDGGDSVTILERTLDFMGPTCLLKPVGNDIYILVQGFDYTDPENEEGEYSCLELYRWDSKTRKGEQLLSWRGTPGGLSIEKQSFFPVPGDGIYLDGFEYVPIVGGDGDGYTYVSHVIKYSFETGKLENVFQLQGGEGEYYDDPFYARDFILFNHSMSSPDGERTHEALLYDYQGSLIRRIDMGDYYFSPLMGVDDDYLYGQTFIASTEGFGSDQKLFAVPLDGGELLTIGE